MSKLWNLLVESDKKKKIFNLKSQEMVGYPTGLITLDYANGYLVNVHNPNNLPEIPNTWANTGIQGGGFLTIIGNSGVGKTALVTKMAANMVRGHELGEVIHIDAESSSNPTHLQSLSKYNAADMNEHYHHIEMTYVEDVFVMICEMADIKLADREFYYNTGRYDSHGEEIIILQPTVFIIDSLPSLQTKDVEDSKELGSQTYNMRLAIAYNTFYKRLRPIIKNANITVMAINHIKDKPQLGFTMTQAKIQYLNPSESIPGGSGPLYYSQTLLRLKYKGKYVMDKHGFDGFLVETEFIKSKTNRSGTKIELVFDYNTGFDEWLTLLHYAQNAGIVKGRNPYCFFESEPSLKFNTKEFREVIETEPKLRTALLKDLSGNLFKMLESGGVNTKEQSPEEFVKLIDSVDWEEVDKETVLVGDGV